MSTVENRASHEMNSGFIGQCLRTLPFIGPYNARLGQVALVRFADKPAKWQQR